MTDPKLMTFAIQAGTVRRPGGEYFVGRRQRRSAKMREPVRTTQQVLGHSSPHTALAFYTQSVEESQRNAMTKLERILFPNVPKFKERPTLTH
ncbi:MAG: hypothetical protein DMG36_18600 [Acidobacteria bacterium]|nr:MAG: hypothetical protein DMG36_18600 [Acidobacteriota bacterium]